MRFADGAKGLIFDLRYNNGGVLEMAQFLMSYLYPAGKDQEFFDYNYNDKGAQVVRSQWSLPAVPGWRSGYPRGGSDRFDVLLCGRMDGVFAAAPGPGDCHRRTDLWGRASGHPCAD